MLTQTAFPTPSQLNVEGRSKRTDINVPLPVHNLFAPAGEPLYPANMTPEHLPEDEELTKAEVNLLLLPVFFLSRKGKKERIEYRAELLRDGERAQILWHVYPGPAGPLGPFEKDVFRAMERLILRRPFPIENPIPFTIYEVTKLMGISSHSGKNYLAIKSALMRISQVTVHSKHAFWSKRRRAWVEDVFHLYERIFFEGEQLPDGRIAETNLLWLGSWYLDSLNAFYLRPFDYRFYRSLESPVAKRLYEILGLKFQGAKERGEECVRFRYSNLCQLLPITRQPFLSKAQEKMAPAHKELTEASFLVGVEWLPVRGEDWVVRYWPGGRALRDLEELHHRTEWQPSWTEGHAAQKAEDEAWIRGLASYLTEELQDPNSYAFYEALARRARTNTTLEDLIHRVLSEVKDDFRRGRVRKSKGAAFTDRLKRYCEERSIPFPFGAKTEGLR